MLARSFNINKLRAFSAGTISEVFITLVLFGGSLSVLSGTQKKAKTDTDKTNQKKEKTVKTDMEKTDNTDKNKTKRTKIGRSGQNRHRIGHNVETEKTDKTDKKQDKTGIALATNKYLSYMLAYI